MKQTRDPLGDTALEGLARGRVLFGPYERLMADKKTWQACAFILLGLVLIFGLGLFDLARRSQVELHLVEVDRFGQIAYAGPLKNESRNPRYIQAALATFIRQLRVVFRDQRAVFEERKNAYIHLTKGVRNYLDRYFAEPENDPRILGRNIWRNVQVESVLPLGSDSWQVHWTEIDYHHNGAVKERTRWVAVIETTFKPIKSPLLLRRNPLGLYVTALSWSPTQGESA